MQKISCCTAMQLAKKHKFSYKHQGKFAEE
jgi:hypothetical protein